MMQYEKTDNYLLTDITALKPWSRKLSTNYIIDRNITSHTFIIVIILIGDFSVKYFFFRNSFWHFCCTNSTVHSKLYYQCYYIILLLVFAVRWDAQVQPMLSTSVCLSVCLSHSWVVSKQIDIFKIFSLSGSHTILVFSVPNGMAIFRREPL